MFGEACVCTVHAVSELAWPTALLERECVYSITGLLGGMISHHRGFSVLFIYLF